MPRHSDRSALPASRPDLPSAVWEKLEQILERFEDAWRRGERPNLGDFLHEKGVPRLALLIELVHEDLHYRLRAGETVRVATYLERYPELRADPGAARNLIVAEFELRQAQPGNARPRWDDFLCQADEADRPALLRHLLVLDLQNRVGHGEQPTPEEYQHHLPEHGTLIDSVFGVFPTGPPAAPGTGVDENRLTPATPPPLPREPTSMAVPGYEILGTLGKGGMGVVYKARQIKADRLVALKMILHGDHEDEAGRDRFRTEAESIARLQHPHIVQIYEIGEVNGLPFFSLEFCPGGSLDKKLKGAPLPPPEAVTLVETLARAMDAAHNAGVVHRDLKPANVLLDKDAQPKVTDFGLAKKVDEAGQTASGAVMGSPSYMAPEQAGGRTKEVGPLADVYALGAILYECLTGRPPFKAATVMDTLIQVLQDEPVPPSRINVKVPRDLEVLCLKCLRKEARQRYSSALELAEDLRRFQQGEPIKARPVGRLERVAKWVRRRPGMAAMVASLALVTLLGFAGILWKYFEAEYLRGQAAWNAETADNERREAVSQKGIAEEKTTAAEKAEKLANEETDLKDKQLKRAEGLVYAGNLLQAQLFWEAGKVREARDRLVMCRPDYRGWEYNHLRRQFHESFATLKGHTGLVWSVCFSPDGKRLATASWDKTVKLWDAASGQEQLTLMGHTQAVDCVCFSPDGKRLASAGGSLKVWDAVSGNNLLTLEGRGDTVCFSPDSKRLATVGAGKVTVLDAASGQSLLTLEGLSCVCFSPNGKWLASVGADMTVRLWDAANGQHALTLKGYTSWVNSVCFSPDSKRLASATQLTAGSPSTVKVWDSTTGRDLLTIKSTSSLSSITFSPDGRRLACASGDNTVKVWDATSGQNLNTLIGVTDRVHAVCFSPDGQRLAGTSDWTVAVWDATRPQDLHMLPMPTDASLGAWLSPDGQRLASANADQTVTVWDTAHCTKLLALKQRTTGARLGVCFSSDNNRLAVASEDLTLWVWDLVTGQNLLTKKRLQIGQVWTICFSPDGKRLAGASGHDVEIWDAGNGESLCKFKGHSGPVLSVCFSPDGHQLASASEDRTVKVWEAGHGEPLLTLKGHTNTVNHVCFSPDGKRLASASGWPPNPGEVKIWDVAAGQELLTLNGHTDAVWRVCFSHDGARLASRSADDTVKVWETSSGQELLTLNGGGSVCFCADGRLLATTERGVAVWEPAHGQEPVMVILNASAGATNSVGFSTDGKRVVGQEYHVSSWDAISGKLIVPCNDPPPPQKRSAVSPDGRLRATADGRDIRIYQANDNRPSSDLVFLKDLNDPVRRQHWHRAEADDSEKAGLWFATAFHLRQMIAADAPDADKLKERLKVCEDKLKQP